MNACKVCALLSAGALLWVAWKHYEDRPRGERDIPWTSITCAGAAFALYTRRDAVPKH
jgi:hypothetical protein